MKHIIQYSFMLALAMSTSLNAIGQGVDHRLERKAVKEALLTIDNYKSVISLADAESFDLFLEQFCSDTAKVYNDFIGFKLGSQISAREYATFQRKNVKTPQIYIGQIYKDRVWTDKGIVKIQLSFDKSLEYTNPNGIHFSTEEFFENKKYRESAILAYDEKKNKCLIESISGSISSSKIFPADYYVLIANSEADKALRYKSATGDVAPLSYNRFNQVFITNGVSTSQFVYPDPDVVTKPLVDEENRIVTMKYQTRRWRVRPHIDLLLGDCYKFGLTDDRISASSSGMNFGVDFGYIFPSKKFVKFSANLGLGIASSKFDLSTSAWNYSYNATGEADFDGDSYIRHYEMGATQQKVSLMHFNMPVYLDADFRLSRIFSAYAQFGFKAYMKMSGKTTDYKSSNYVYGIYPQYDNLRLDENWRQANGTPFNGFGSHEYSLDDVTDPTITPTGVTIDVFGGIGLRISPFKSFPMAFEFGMQYQTSLMETLEYNRDGLDVTNSFGALRAINSYTLKDGENIRQLSDGINSLKRQNIQLNIGLILKF